MIKERYLIYIFFYNDKIFKYKQTTRLNVGLSRVDVYNYLNNLAQCGVNLFLRDVELDNFEIDFMIILDKIPYFMYVKRESDTYLNCTYVSNPITKIDSEVKNPAPQNKLT